MSSLDKAKKRFELEKDFHDNWAEETSISNIDVIKINEAETSPELRYIFKILGSDLKNKKVLDIGCGLGEVSVYFAIKGAQVTATDISPKMLDLTNSLAKKYNVTVKTHLSTAENLEFDNQEKFDVIYTGNLLHHVDIKETLDKIVPHLNDEGVFISWDPLSYNPVINNYRKKAFDVRTIDEHPLKSSDIKLMSEYFSKVETKYFWLTTLIIFVIMALFQRRDPNKERYWKVVIDETEYWAPLYLPLEKLDRIFLRIFPFLKWWCWNVVFIGRK